MDSKPTNAHGANAKMVKVPPALLCAAENAGLSAAVPPLFTSATTKQIMTTAKRVTAITICETAAAFLRKQTSAPMSSEKITISISPKYTLNPAIS